MFTVALAYFDPFGFPVLDQKERTKVERNVKRLLKDVSSDLSDTNTNGHSQCNQAQARSSSSPNNQSITKSLLTSFPNSVSTDATLKYRVSSNPKNSNSIGDELLLYKSLATKEVQKLLTMIQIRIHQDFGELNQILLNLCN